MTGTSAWCTPAPGTRHSVAQHQVCQMRLDSGHIASCSCPDHPKKKDAA